MTITFAELQRVIEDGKRPDIVPEVERPMADRDAKLWARHVEGATQRVIAAEFGLSQMTVWKILKRMKGKNRD